MDKPVINSEEWIVSLNDVKQLYISMWKRLVKCAFIGGIVSYLYFGNAEVEFKTEASFKEGVERTGSESFFKELMGGVSATTQPQTTSLMKSNQVLRPLAEKLGLQIQPNAKEWKFAKLVRRYKETRKAEKWSFIEDLDPFVFSDAHYDGENPIFFQIIFSSETEYTLFDQKRKKVMEMKQDLLVTQTEKFSSMLSCPGIKYNGEFPTFIELTFSLLSAINSERKADAKRMLKSVSFEI